ncbi:hypothetical protein C2U69_15250 [Cupriavidus pinatubonensis]|nr:hypothetical protein C2U69_15250 [Cupriavidus pinatubonensis]
MRPATSLCARAVPRRWLQTRSSVDACLRPIEVLHLASFPAAVPFLAGAAVGGIRPRCAPRRKADRERRGEGAGAVAPACRLRCAKPAGVPLPDNCYYQV